MATATKRNPSSSSSSGGSRIGKLLLWLILLASVVAVSIAGTFYIMQKMGLQLGPAFAESSEPAPIERRQAELPAPIFAPLEPFTVTLRDERTTRILYVAITLRLVDESSRNMITEYMPEVRDRVLRLLAVQNPTYVQTPEGRERLVQDLTQLLQRPYLPQPRGPEISAVLFTAFVVQ
ncbi:flagellar protein FliL [bacterium SGD-2]|nr:flagellar protein FliL [bacterium SGD-2]